MVRSRFNNVKCLIAALCVLICVSCGGSSVMRPAQSVTDVQPDYALVTFLRPSIYFAPHDYDLWDGENLIGALHVKCYIQYKATPGEHVFMARAENWSLVKANLEAGKKYYILADAGMGGIMAKVLLRPIRQNDPEYNQANIDEWLGTLSPMEPDPAKAESYKAARMPAVGTALENYRNGRAETKPLDAVDSFN